MTAFCSRGSVRDAVIRVVILEEEFRVESLSHKGWSSDVEVGMRTHHYPSDVTDEQWALIEPHIPRLPRRAAPQDRHAGRRRRHLLHPPHRLPVALPARATSRPRAPSGGTSTEWRHNGTLDTIHDLLRRKVRTAEKPYHPRTTASVDSQSVDTTSGGEQRGRDNAKNVDGRKRHIVVDSMGLLLAVLVTAASTSTTPRRPPELFARLEGQPMGKVVRMYADTKYHNFALYEWVEANARWDLAIVRRPEGSEGLGEAADPVDGGADVRLAGPVPPAEQGPGEERAVVGVVHQAGDDPADAQPARALGRRMPSSTTARRPDHTYGTDSDGLETEATSDVLVIFLRERPEHHPLAGPSG